MNLAHNKERNYEKLNDISFMENVEIDKGGDSIKDRDLIYIEFCILVILINLVISMI